MTVLGGVVLAGGRGSRLGGVQKADLRHDGTTLLDRALAACADCAEVVVVGDGPGGGGDQDERCVRFVREEPVYGGPASALLAGVGALAPGTTTAVVIGVDMPLLDRAAVRRLLAAAGPDGSVPPDGSVLVDAAGRRHLALVVRTEALARVAPPPAERTGMPLRRLLAGLRLVPVPARAGEEADVDTWDDAARLGVERDVT